MRCIFCGKDCEKKSAIEHIVPESLDNKTLLLPKGYVCIQCNNYLGREVEAPFINHPLIMTIRSQLNIESKKGSIPSSIINIENVGNAILSKRIINGRMSWFLGVDESQINALLQAAQQKKIIYEALNGLPPKKITNRFACKVAIELLAYNMIDTDEIKYFANTKEFMPLINYVRYDPRKIWPVNSRKIWQHFTFMDNSNKSNLIFRSKSLIIDNHIFYMIFILYGYEFAVNLFTPEISNYKNWLEKNNNISPL
ncbi:MAG TPA: HNH endonuclease [Bacilli bacterium]|nr:HNH endonuclease [Bacilli bacterium]